MRNFEIGSGIDLLPRVLRSMMIHESGAMTLRLDSTDHDIDLLRSIAKAVRDDESVVGNLIHLANIEDRISEAEGRGARNYSEVRALEGEATDARAEIDAALEPVNLGDGFTAFVHPGHAREVAAALNTSEAVSA